MKSSLRSGPDTAKIFAFLVLGLSLLTSPTWAQNGTVAGTVKDAEGNPLPGVLVVLQMEDGRSRGDGTSDEDGAFSITGVPAGTYTATASLDGFETSSRTVEVTAGAQVTVTFRIRPEYHEALVVTAQRVEENILEVPMTITAFDSGMLEELVIKDQTDLQMMTPGLQFGDDTEQDGQGTVIRGIGTRQAYYQHNDLAVATYVDGAYTLGVYGVAPAGGFDMERVEVARGPQGTLNGRNSIAGAINLVTKGPTDRWDAELLAEATDVSHQRYGAAIGGPLGGDLFSFRLTGALRTGDGRQENIGPGGDYDAPDQTFWAPQLRVATNRFSLSGRYSRVEDDGTPRSFVQLSNQNRTDPFIPESPAPGAALEPNPRYLYETPNPAIDPNCPIGVPGFNCGDLENKVALNFPGFSESESDFFTLNADYQLSDSLNVAYNYSRSDVSNVSIKDADYTARVPVGENPNTLDHTIAADGMVTPFDNVYYRLPFVYDETSHELQFSSTFAGRFNFIAGLFYYENTRGGQIDRHDLAVPFRFGTADEQAVAASPIFGFVPVNNCQDVLVNVIVGFGIGSIDPANPQDGLVWYCPEGSEHTFTVNFFSNSSSETQAAYFSGNYQFNDRWMLSGGLRYTEDEKEQFPEEQGGFAVFNFGGVPLGVTFAEGEGNPFPQTWDQPIGHVALHYTTDDGNLVYGRISTGYRAGGFNIGLPDQVPPFIEEETLVNYELGWKGLFVDSRLQLTTGLWYNDFDGYQLAALQQAPPGFEVPDFSNTPLAEYTANIDDTQIWGLDFEFSYWVNEKWRFSGYYAYQDSEIGPHSSVILGDPDPQYGEWEHIDFETGQLTTSFYPLPTDQTGNRLPMQPENKLALTASYNTPLGPSAGYLQVLTTYSFTDDQFADIGNIPIYTLPSYQRWDAGATWTAPGDQWSVTLFVQNIANEIGVVEFLPVAGNGGNPALGYLTNPREYGLQLRWRPFR